MTDCTSRAGTFYLLEMVHLVQTDNPHTRRLAVAVNRIIKNLKVHGHVRMSI